MFVKKAMLYVSFKEIQNTDILKIKEKSLEITIFLKN